MNHLQTFKLVREYDKMSQKYVWYYTYDDNKKLCWKIKVEDYGNLYK